MKKILLSLNVIILCAFFSVSVVGQVASWDFTGENNVVTSTADSFNANLTVAPVLTRGAGSASSAGNNSFRTVGFQNNGIATTNTDYFEVQFTASAGNVLSIHTIDARMAGTATFANAPGVSQQFAYSTDGVTFTLIDSPQTIVGTPQTLTQINTTGISALQNVAAGITVTLRYYATGQTATGGWGFNSPSAGTNGLAIGGFVGTALDITTSNTMPNGNVGIAYTTSLTGTGGVAPYTFAVVGGSVPTGLTLNSDGTWSGSPTTTGTFNFDVTITDSNPLIPSLANSTTESFQITVTAPTAASATISGQARTSDGRGLGKVRIMLSGGDLVEPIFAETSSFGYYNFNNITVGQSYVLQVVGGRYTFQNSSRVINLDDNLTDEDFIVMNSKDDK